MTAPLNIGVAGAGQMGRRHAELVRASSRCALAAIADPSPEARGFASALGCPWYPSHQDMLSSVALDGVIVASPNALHVPVALDCVAAGVPTLVEKPIAETRAGATALSVSARRAKIPILVGHHRRYNPLVRETKRLIEAGEVGALTAVSILFLVLKPEHYFETRWRRQSGAGPILINLVHDIDSVRFICGEISEVQAIASNAIRHFEVEDTAAALLKFACGALGTVMMSDAVAAPFSWELTSGENPAYPRQDADCYVFAGTKGAITFPGLTMYSYQGPAGWNSPLIGRRTMVRSIDPLIEQLAHFCDVVQGKTEPIISVEDATRSVAVVEAIKQAAETARPVRLQFNEEAVG